MLENGEGGSPDRLPCQKMVGAYCNGVSLGAPLPGCVRLVTLNWHALKNALKNSGRRSIVKKHGKKGFKQVLERSDGVLDFSSPNFCFE